MKIVSWNVAGLRACLKKGFADFFYAADADIYCLQEVKALEEQIDFEPDGYHLYINPAEKKGYSGTLIWTCYEPLSVTYGLGIPEHDHEGRVITLEFEDFYLVNQYVPNSKDDLSRLDYRMTWEDDLRKYLKKLEQKKPVVMCGDLNVAHEEIDLKNPKPNMGHAGFTNEERAKFTELLNSGFIDTYRYYNPDKIEYTWWSYFRNARATNAGWRIDYFVVSKSIIDRVTNTHIYTDVYGSDHCPISITMS